MVLREQEVAHSREGWVSQIRGRLSDMSDYLGPIEESAPRLQKFI
jgi:hypothetical protein